MINFPVQHKECFRRKEVRAVEQTSVLLVEPRSGCSRDKLGSTGTFQFQTADVGIIKRLAENSVVLLQCWDYTVYTPTLPFL